MKTTAKITLIMMIGFALTVTPGWAGEKMNQSGFLSDYSKLTQDDPLKVVDWLYVNKNANYKAYDKIILQHATFFLKEDAEYKGMQADEMNELAEALHKTVSGALSDVYTFTDEPGPGVMVLRIAITDMVPNKAVVGTVTTIIPVGLVLSGAKKLTTGTHIGMGGVSFEGELLDSQTNEVLLAVVNSETGKKYKIGKSVTKWGQVKEIFKACAKTFRKRLDSLSGREQ